MSYCWFFNRSDCVPCWDHLQNTYDELLEAGLGNDIARLKATLGVPATVVSVQANGSGFDDFENDLDFDAPSKAPKMFPTRMKPLEKIK